MEAVRRLPWHVLLVDVGLAIAVGALAVAVGSWAGHGLQPASGPVGVLLVVAVVAPLAVRRLCPLPSFALVVVALTAYLAVGTYGPVLLAACIGAYTIATRLPATRSLAAAAGSALLLAVPGLLTTGAGAMPAAQTLAWAGAWLLVPWAVGAVVKLNRDAAARDREAEISRRAYEQRLQVAREVHDVVGHGLAVINMQAGIALHVLDRRPEQAPLALEAIRRTSKESLDELRATLSVFRRPDGERRIEPGLGQLQALVEAMAEHGLPVELVLAGTGTALPVAVDVAAYRIVQESLTNVVRHASAPRAIVRVERRDGEVVVEVTDEGRARPGAGQRPAGHGIAGMRERAAALGGELSAGPRQEGGYRVLARLPIGAPS